jgi:hypothetical protein
MNYHVNRQGLNVGVFSLEELRRRREAGEFGGSEWVWREGMAQWQLLDLVLKQGDGVGTGAPQPPPLTPASPRRGRWVVPAVIGVGALFFVAGLAGLGYFVVQVAKKAGTVSRQMAQSSGSSGVASASQPIVWTSNSLTAADLVKSQGEFVQRVWVGGYRLRGAHEPAYHDLGVRFLEEWAKFVSSGDDATNWSAVSELGNQLATNPACQEPLLLTLAADNSNEGFERIRRYDRALAAYEKSKHLAYPRLYAAQHLAALVSNNGDRVHALDAASVTLLGQALKDGSLLPADQVRLAELLLDGWGERFLKRNRKGIRAAVQSAGADYEWLRLVLDGELEIEAAWAARGNGYANTVNSENWKGFEEHLAAARRSLTRAWELRPDAPQAGRLMITVAMGDSDGGEMRTWFDRATTAQLDDAEAWHKMRWGLRPRWHGSLEAMRALGVAAVETGRFDTDVPYKLMNVVYDLELERGVQVGERLFGEPDLWPHIQKMYEGYVRQYAHSSKGGWWQGTYAAVAYLAQQPEVARQQLEALNWEPQAVCLTGWGRDLSLMPLEVAARTGKDKEKIEAAERDYWSGFVAKSLSKYRALSDAGGLDERSGKFVRHRLASLEAEQTLVQGGWLNLLPASEGDPKWAGIWGGMKPLTNGGLEVQTLSEGHLGFCRARLGAEFVVRGEFRVVKTSNQSFQGGLAIGWPSTSHSDWFGFRIKRNTTEGDVASLSTGWARTDLYHPVVVKDDVNTFEFQLKNHRVTASVNGSEVFHESKLPGNYSIASGDLKVGVGAYHDSNETTIRYTHLEAKRL